ncbi:MAG TPA: hypothetical protein VIF64_19960 [Pyrinomonadaceae bacterium]|jgi:hypothetical protein
MKRFKSILCTSLLTLAISSSAFAGNITGKSGNITGSPSSISGNITGTSLTDAVAGIILYVLIP